MMMNQTSLTFCLWLYLFLIFLTGGAQVSLEVHVQQIVLIELPAESRDPGRDPFHPTSARPVDKQQTQDVHYCRWEHRLRPEAGFSVTDLGCGGGRGCEEFGLVGTVIPSVALSVGLVVKRHVIRDEPATTRHLWILALRNLFRVLDGFSYTLRFL